MTATLIQFTDTKGRRIELPADKLKVKKHKDRWCAVTRVQSYWISEAEAMRLTGVLAGVGE